MVIRRVNPLSAAKIGGITGVILGLILGALFTLLGMLAGGLATATSSDMPGGGAFMGMLFGAGAIIVLPIVYGVCAFIGGLLYAALYNLAAKWVGGLEIETS